MQSNKYFGEKIKQLRKASNMTQDELGEKMYCNRYRIMDLERGKSGPTIDDIVKLCNIFDVSADYLLGLSDVQSTDTTVKGVCDFTGLSEKAVNRLKFLNMYSFEENFNRFLNDFVSSYNFECIIYEIANYYNISKQLKEIVNNQLLGDISEGKFNNLNDKRDLSLFKASKEIISVIEEIAKDFAITSKEKQSFYNKVHSCNEWDTEWED